MEKNNGYNNFSRKLAGIRTLISKVNILPKPFASHGDHFVNVAERTHQLIEGSFPPQSEQPTFWDERGYPHYLPEHHPVANRTDVELGWDSEGTYFTGER